MCRRLELLDDSPEGVMFYKTSDWCHPNSEAREKNKQNTDASVIPGLPKDLVMSAEFDTSFNQIVLSVSVRLFLPPTCLHHPPLACSVFHRNAQSCVCQVLAPPSHHHLRCLGIKLWPSYRHMCMLKEMLSRLECAWSYSSGHAKKSVCLYCECACFLED